MKAYFIIVFLLIFALVSKAQTVDFEIKVISKKYENVKGKLQKVSPEGIAIEDYRGNYLIFRAEDIVKLKVRKRGLTIGEGAGTGALAGLGAGAAIWSIDQENQSFADMAKLTGVLTVSGAAIGTVTGIIAELVNTKLSFTVDGDPEKFKKNYKKLEQYIVVISTQHVN